MAELKEERAYIKLHFKQAKHSMETFQMLKAALRKQALGRTKFMSGSSSSKLV